MRNWISFLFFFILTLGHAQFEQPKKTIRIGAVKKKEAPPQKVDTTKAEVTIKYESSIGKEKKDPLLENFSILPDKVGSNSNINNDQPRNPSELYTDKMNKSQHDGEILAQYRSDSFLGEYKTGSRVVKMACRDHEAPDGDYVRIWVNDKVAIDRILLDVQYREVVIQLEEGINKVEIEALNQGDSGPNTAQFVVVDEKGTVITNNKWNLTTGAKAKLILTRAEIFGK